MDVEHAPAHTAKRGPACPQHITGLGRKWYESLRTSGQSIYYTDSDWTAAMIQAKAIQAFEENPTASMLAAINNGLGSLAATEGERRKLNLELERDGGTEEAGDVSWIDDARSRLRAAD